MLQGGADVVLVDAPCSSSGVLRRHPSQRWILTPAEVCDIRLLVCRMDSERGAPLPIVCRGRGLGLVCGVAGRPRRPSLPCSVRS